MLTAHGDSARDTDLVDERNFVTDAAQATHIRFLLVRGCHGTCFFSLVRDQVVGADHDVFKLYRLAAFDLGKATKNAAHKHIVQAVFYHNGAIVIHARNGCGLLSDCHTCKADDTTHVHTVASRGAVYNLFSIHSGLDLRGNLDRRRIVHNTQILGLGKACRTYDTAQVGIAMQAINCRSRGRKRNDAFGFRILDTQEIAICAAAVHARSAIADNATGKVLVFASHLQVIGHVDIGIAFYNLERSVRFGRIKAHEAAHRHYIQRRSFRNFTAKLAVPENEFSGIIFCTKRGRFEHSQCAKEAAHRRTARNAGQQNFALRSDTFNDLQVFVGIADGLYIARDTAQSRLMARGLVNDIHPNGIVDKGLVSFTRVADSNASQATQEHVIASFHLQLGRAGIAIGNSNRVRHDNAITRDIRNCCIANITSKASCNGALNRGIRNADTIDQRKSHHTRKGARRVVRFTFSAFVTDNNAHAIELDIFDSHAVCSFEQAHRFFSGGDIAKILDGLAFSIEHGAVDSRERHMVYIALALIGGGRIFAQVDIGTEFKGYAFVFSRLDPVCFKHLGQVLGSSGFASNANVPHCSRTLRFFLAKNQRGGTGHISTCGLSSQVKIRGCCHFVTGQGKTHAGKRQHGKQKQTDFCFHKTLNYLLLLVKIP